MRTSRAKFSADGRKLRCGNASRYKGYRAPTCGCAACERTWDASQRSRPCILMSCEFKLAIKRLGWTQDALAKAIGVRRATVVDWCAGRASPRRKKDVAALAKTLGMPASQVRGMFAGKTLTPSMRSAGYRVLKLGVPGDVEARILETAKRAGVDPAELLMEMIDEGLKLNAA